MNNLIDFDSERHIYHIDGVVLPSVTQLIQALYGNIYERVDTQLLQRASEYGTLVHSEIERYLKYNDTNCTTQEAKTFIEKVIPSFNIKYVMSEKRIALKLDNDFVACGTLDLLAYMNNTLYLVDFKTTSSIHIKEVTLQLNLYAKGLKDTTDDEFMVLDTLRLAIIQLKANNYVVKEIPRLDDNVVSSRLRIALDEFKKASSY